MILRIPAQRSHLPRANDVHARAKRVVLEIGIIHEYSKAIQSARQMVGSGDSFRLNLGSTIEVLAAN